MMDMPMIPPRTGIEGIKAQAAELTDAAFKRGVKQGRYLAQLEYAKMKAERDALLAFVKANIKAIDDGCAICAHYIECRYKDCPMYEEGVNDATICKPDGMVVGVKKNVPWCCLEWDICRMREGTPCERCDFENHWEWGGVKDDEEA